MAILSKSFLTILNKFQIFMGTITLNKTACAVSSGTVSALGAQIRSVSFLETALACQTDLIVILYSVASSGLPATIAFVSKVT
jgi:hypothetical protein